MVAVRVAYTLEQCWHDVPGGTATAAIEVARELRTRPDDVELVGVAARHADPPPAAFNPPVEVVRLRLTRPVLYESWHHLRRPKVQTATGRVDVIHATTPITPPRSAPLVCTVHDLAFLHQPDAFTAHGVRVMRRGFELVRDEADLVLCSSVATFADCEAHGIDTARLRSVPLGVHIEKAQPADLAGVRARYALARPYLLFAGTLEPRKNLDRLVEAYRPLADQYDLVLVGPTGWGPDLAPRIAGLGERVKPLGFVPAADLRALYAGAEVFCYPSLREGFGLPVLEAMAQGTPVVTSAGTSTEEVAGGAAVLVDPYDTAAIAAGIGRAIEERSLLRERGLARAAAMTWAHTAERTLAAYREVARG